MESAATGVSAVDRFYTRWAGVYDLFASAAPGISGARRQSVDALGVTPGDTVVEMGCGTGANLPYLREAIGSAGGVVGVDLADGALARARLRIERADWENVDAVRGDATRPPTARVDALLATFVVGMFDDPAAVVDGWCDRLAPGGRVAMLNAARSDRRVGAPVNLALDAVTALSTPPTWQLRYDHDLSGRLTERVEAAAETVDRRVADASHDRFLLGLVRLTSGRVPDQPADG